MNSDRKQMMDERKSLMREFRQVRQAMSMKKEKPDKKDVDPREVLREIRNRMLMVPKVVLEKKINMVVTDAPPWITVSHRVDR